MSIGGRLSRLEAQSIPIDSLRLLTWDELQVRSWDLLRGLIADDGGTSEEISAWRDQVEEIESGIIAQAAARADPGYEAFLAAVVETLPSAVTSEGYVSATCGFEGNSCGRSEYVDCDKLRIMQRRAAIAARPDVQALIAAASLNQPAEKSCYD